MLSDAKLDESLLTNANFANAEVVRASFRQTTPRGFTKEQLYSTASYGRKDLQGISLSENDLSGWNLRGQNFQSAEPHIGNSDWRRFYKAQLSRHRFRNAIVNRARFSGTTAGGLTKEQLYSTASYKQMALEGIHLDSNDMTG